MALNKTVTQKGNQTNNAVARPLKRTRGEIKSWDRGVWKFMQKQYKIPETELIHLNGAVCPAKVNGITATVIRFYNTEKAEEMKLNIQDYENLSEHPEMIEYEGYYIQGKAREINIKKWKSIETSFLEEQTHNGTITDVGIVIPKTPAQKILGGLGKFMLMGGFLVVLVVVIVLMMLIALWSKGC